MVEIDTDPDPPILWRSDRIWIHTTAFIIRKTYPLCFLFNGYEKNLLLEVKCVSFWFSFVFFFSGAETQKLCTRRWISWKPRPSTAPDSKSRRTGPKWTRNNTDAKTTFGIGFACCDFLTCVTANQNSAHEAWCDEPACHSLPFRAEHLLHFHSDKFLHTYSEHWTVILLYSTVCTNVGQLERWHW
jgi:hypothetical protein